MSTDTPSVTIKVYVITYRRPVLLKRALNSLLQQTHTTWIAEVINDDPDDLSVANLLADINDSRIILSAPAVKRGGTQNFNYALKPTHEPFATILEDDNWYEPTYLEMMLSALQNNPGKMMAVGNQNIWIEGVDGSWTNSERTIWKETTGTSFYRYQLKDKCGSAKICNSSMLWRTEPTREWLTPDDIPIDVTEHFRERIIPHPILLVNTPLVNYAQTIHTNRSDGLVWSMYQVLLIASVFVNLTHHQADALAGELWATARNGNPLYKTALLHSGLSHPKAGPLFKISTLKERLRYALVWLKSPRVCYKAIKAPELLSSHFVFLINSLNNQQIER
ncbi:glycosyltransferase family 2 protein [Inquilinus sp. KBS0705]|nr:glycosyltransferase family 2 protein [Inquilinus sp. KBS0705]